MDIYMDLRSVSLQVCNIYKVVCISWEFELDDTLIPSHYKILTILNIFPLMVKFYTFSEPQTVLSQVLTFSTWDQKHTLEFLLYQLYHLTKQKILWSV